MLWDNDNIDSATHKAAGEIQLRNYGKCLDDYSIKLQRIEDTLDETVNNSWDLSVDPAVVQSSPAEQCTLVQLIDTDNKILNKVLIALAATCAEIEFLQVEAKTKYFTAILFYGEGTEEDGATSISHMLPTLQKIASFISRCELVLKVAIQQLSSLHNSKKNVPALDVQFQVVIEHIGDLLVILVTLDELFQNQSILKDHWCEFKRTMKAVIMDIKNFGDHTSQIHSLDQAISVLEQTLLAGVITKHALEQLLEGPSNLITGAAVTEQLAKYIRTCAPDLDSDLDPQILWLRLCALFVLYSTLSGNTDKKLFKLILDPHKKIIAVTLIGNILWHPEEFMLSHLPHLSQIVDKKAKSSIISNRLAYLQQKSQSLPRETQLYYFQVSSWLIQMDTCMRQDSTNLKIEHLQMRCSILLQGLEYAISLNRIAKTLTNLHVSLGQPMTRTSVIAVCRLIELLKCIQFMYHAHAVAVAESVNHVIQHLTYQALGIIIAAKKNVAGDSRYSATQLDVLSSLLLAERALHGPGTKERRLVALLALSTANQMKTFKEDGVLNLKSILRRLDNMCELNDKLKRACDCSFLYWHRVIIPIYLAHLYESRTDLHRVKYIYAAMNDCITATSSTALKEILETHKNLKKNLQKEMYNAFESQVLQPLCHQIETDLRLHVHSHLQLEDRNPFLQNTNNWAMILKTQPLRFSDQYIYIKAYVENHLNKTFYNLTTVALHDWKTYGEMRCLAKQKYDLNTVEDDLPSQTLEQGLDVLEIMRNIHVFVSKYLYNLNNQIFVENSSNNKHLNTINIRHIANSIRTHGTGIMNTTVNFTYQFLKKKFQILSQFLYDEQIKSRLMRDLKYFRETKAQTEQKYSFDRAEKFNRGIRKLGLSPDKLTYLDQFRILITHIGNAMGYIRMIRTGGLHCCSNAICFIPDLDDIVSFQELSQDLGFSASSLGSAKAVDNVLETLARNFDESTEYFKLLVDVFAPVCRDPKNLHLQNFHVIVPPLTINFVEHSIMAKDKMTKKNKFGAAFTDDGFAMGVAYILKMLDLNTEFDSLHWFQSVSEKYAKEKSDLLAQKANISKEEEKLHQTMTLTARRLDLYQQEFELLYYSLSSARIFFHKYSQTVQGEPSNKS